MASWKPTIQFSDSIEHGSQSAAELLIVEGESAAKAAIAVRDPQTQAILPLQGKPMNALKASPEAVRKYPFFTQLVEILGVGWEEGCSPIDSRFSKVIFLFDPDADGIHCGLLMLLFFYRWLRPMLEAEQVFVIQPPIMEILSEGELKPKLIFQEKDQLAWIAELDARKEAYTKKRFRGLASLSANTLHEACLSPTTRSLRRLRTQDAEASLKLMETMWK